MSQNRSVIIERKAKLAGYKSLLETSFESNHVETAFWLNAIIGRVWRVDRPGSLEVGGFEPFLASSVGSLFASRLEESYARPSGVAHVSLASLTFGKSAPIVHDIQIKGVDSRGSKVYLGIDVVMLMEDAVLMLGE
jgi:Ca2+-dependent lipid-binding protein